MRHCGHDGAIRIVRHFMANQCARSRAAIVRNRHRAVRSNYIQVEVDKSVAADVSISARDSVRSVAS